MFAYAIWSEETRTCVLARDRLGVKPLTYAVLDGVLYFASEAQALLAAPGIARRLDPAALGDFLTHGYVPAPRSIWRHLRKLPPAHQLVFRDGEARLERYWAPPGSAVGGAVDAAPAGTESGVETAAPPGSEPGAEALRELLADAVAHCMVSDVPIAAFLSGGLDSGTVTALMAGQSATPVRTFTIDFAHTARSEARFAEQVAERHATDHHRIAVDSGRPLETLRRVVAAYDEPLADESAVPTYLMAEEVARHTKVVLSGDGGDEAFAGYAWYRKAARIDAARHRLGPLAGLLAAVGRRLAAGGVARHALGWRLAHRLELLGGDPLTAYQRAVGFFDAGERRALFRDALVRDMDDDCVAPLRQAWNPELPLVRRLQLVDIETMLPGAILVKVDRASMRHALEVRVPLLDHRLVETALHLPLSRVFADGRGKLALRAAARDLLPAPLLSRPKQGFGLPRAEWGRDGWERAVRERLWTGELRRRDWIDPAALERLVRDRRGRAPNRIWLLFVLDLWLERHDVL
jgi:asparagine synthase (glutamine-hydrolysing)